MTNEQHIENLKKLKSFHIHNGNYDPDIDRAIRALKQEPIEYAVKREQVNDILGHCIHSQEDYYLTIKMLNDLPSVTPQPKTGHWILTDDDFVYCSECEDSYYPRPIDASWYYCPNCGARMVESQESEDE